jgi:DNA polymerase-3 subunit alpha
VIRYVTEKYGSDHVSQIVTFGRMKAKAAIRDCGRVLSIPLPVVDRIAKLIPLNSSIEQALGTDEIKKIYQSEPQARQILDTAKVVEGLARNVSIHAAGVIISKDPLNFHVPLQKMAGEEVVAQYEMNSVSDIGLLKMDFLGLRNLTVMKNCLEMIRKNKGIEVSLDLAHLPLDDEKTYKLLQDARTVGVFQLESSGMQGYLKQLRPDRFEDIVALCALYRPGPLGSGMVDDFIKGRHGRKKVEYLHPLLEPILKETYGVIIYQEQVMQIAHVMADFSMAQADDLRKAMGKKKEEVMARQEKAFMEGAKKKGIDLRIAKKIWELMVFFAGYGFNKSHTVAYAIVAYQTAYLKANYPLEYMAALMTSFMDKIDKLSFVVKECRTMGLNVLPPHINESEVEFSVKGDAIRFGLAGIKNVGRNAIESIIETRNRCGAFASIGQLCSDVDLRLVNKKVMESLAKSGAMDCLGETRATIMANLDYLLDCAGRIQKEKRSGQISLFEAAGCGADIQRIELTHRAPEYERESILAFEKEMLGLYISDHPLNSVRELLKEKVKYGLGELDHVPDGSLANCAGIINSIKRITTKKNQTMAFLAIEDFSGTAEVVVLPKVYEKTREYLVEDSIIIVKAKVEFKEKGADNAGGSDEEEARLEVKLLAEDIYPIEAIDAMETIRGQEEPKLAGCHIRVDCGKWEHLEQLKNVIQKSKGAVPVYLHLESPGGKTVIAVEKDFWILHTKDFKEIVENLMGAGTVWDQ